MTTPGPAVNFECAALLSPEDYARAQQEAAELFAQMATNSSAVTEYGADAIDKANKLTAKLLSDNKLMNTEVPVGTKAQLEWLESKRDAYNVIIKDYVEAEPLMIYTIAVMELVHELIVQGLSQGSAVDEPTIIAERSQLSDMLGTRITEYKFRLVVSLQSKLQLEELRNRTIVQIGHAEILLTRLAGTDSLTRAYLLARMERRGSEE